MGPPSSRERWSRASRSTSPDRAEIALAGAGAAQALWRHVLVAVSGLPVVRRAVDDAASVGARLIVSAALGDSPDLDGVNPMIEREPPDSSLVAAYRPIRAASDAAAAALLG